MQDHKKFTFKKGHDVIVNGIQLADDLAKTVAKYEAGDWFDMGAAMGNWFYGLYAMECCGINVKDGLIQHRALAPQISSAVTGYSLTSAPSVDIDESSLASTPSVDVDVDVDADIEASNAANVEPNVDEDVAAEMAAGVPEIPYM